MMDDFLPPELRSASPGELAGMMMPWRGQLAVGGEVRTCPQYGTDRDWMILSILRRRAGHETPETALGRSRRPLNWADRADWRSFPRLLMIIFQGRPVRAQGPVPCCQWLM